jgi:xanthosine phosphorylase
MPRDMVKDVGLAHQYIQQRIGARRPKIALLLGSGLGDIANDLQDPFTINYAEIDGFPIPGVAGHDGQMVFGKLEGVDVVFLKGRVHAYETSDFQPLKTLLRSLQAFGIETLFTTSASGSLHEDMPPGAIMAISDHINMMGINPLLGPNEDDFGPRFLEMSDAWGKDTRQTLLDCAQNLNIKLHEGVYMGFRGPCFETHAEVNMARILGADAVGMSAIPENIIANHCGLNIIGCAVITNLAAGMLPEKLSHDQTLAGAKIARDDLSRLVKSFVKAL